MMTIYKGQRIFQRNEEGEELRGQIVVTADGQPLDPRLDLLNKSPDGFEWGYQGSGPAQLAFAILMHEFQVESFAVMLFQDFKSACIAPLKRDYWDISTEQIQAFLGELSAVKIIVPQDLYADEVVDLCDLHDAKYDIALTEEGQDLVNRPFIVYALAAPALLAALKANDYAVQVLFSQATGQGADHE
jgi:Family of unknown function (DUF6166)